MLPAAVSTSPALVGLLPSGIRPVGRWAVTWCLLLALCAVLTLQRLPLVDEDEGEYSEVAMEMARSVDWRAPTLNAVPFYEKPVLLFWLQAPLVRWAVPAGMPLETALRLPALLATLGWMALLVRALPGLAGWQAAWLAATSLGVAVVGRAAAMESLINLCLCGTLLALLAWLQSGARRPLREAAVWAGFGVLAKGPVALVVPGLVVLALLALDREARRTRWRDLGDLWAWALLVTIAAPWYAWYAVHSDGAFVAYFLGRENVGRLGGSLQGHSGGWAYYLAVLPCILLPWPRLLAAVPAAIVSARHAREPRFLLTWLVVVLVVFTLAGTKLPHYVLYGATPLFLLGATRLPSSPSRLDGLPGLVLPALALALPQLALRALQHSPNPYLHELLARAPEVLDAGWQRLAWAWALAALALALVLALGAGRALRAAAGSPAGMQAVFWPWLPGALSVAGVSLVLLPAVTGLQQDPVRAAAARARQMVADGPVTVVADNRMPSFAVYLGRPTTQRAVQAGDLAFGRLDHPDRLGSQYQVLFAEGGVRLVRVLAP